MIYLNNAAAGWPKAPGVADAVRAALEAMPTGEGRDSAEAHSVVSTARKRVARFLSVEDPDRIVFTLNATHALNLAIHGLDLAERSLVVTSAAEHNAVLRPLAHLQMRRGIRRRVVTCGGDGSVNLDDYEDALRHGPSLVALTHASNVTGCVNDIALLFGMAKAAGSVTLLDASQSVGHITVSPAALAADMIAFQGHKGLHGAEGAGVLYVHDSLNLEQVVTGGTGVRSDLELHPSEMPTRLEAGTPNTPALAGLVAALEWFEKDGRPHSQRAAEHTRGLRRQLAQISQVLLYESTGDNTTPVVSFRITGMSTEECGFILRESFGIVSRTGLHCAPLVHAAIGSVPGGTVRLSPSGFSTSEEIEAAVSAIGEVARCASMR